MANHLAGYEKETTLHERETSSGMRILMVSTEYPPMRGGVGRYTSSLTSALLKIGSDTDPQPEIHRKKGTVEVFVVCDREGNGQFSGIYPRNPQNSAVLLKIVEMVKPDIVHIQFEPGLYGLELGLAGLKGAMTNIDHFYRQCPVPIVTTFHSAYALGQWVKQAKYLKRSGRTGFVGIPARATVRMWKHLLNYKSFVVLNREKLAQSKAGIVFSNSMYQLLGGHARRIYHGAEPALESVPSKEESRSYFSMNLAPRIRIALAVGFGTDSKGWDILQRMSVPDEWIIVINSSQGHYSTEKLKVKVRSRRIVDLEKGFLSDVDLSKLFYASDAVLLPYKITSSSGVLFDALSHGLPFVDANLDFFKEFADLGLGIVVERKPSNFSIGLEQLHKNYNNYANAVANFKERLKWSYVATEHFKIYRNIITNSLVQQG